jgi:zinc/manganese transport system permease protein
VVREGFSAVLSSAGGLSWNPATDIRQLLAEHFMVNALRAGTIVAVLAGAIGWFMVMRRQSFAGHTVALVSFPGASGAILIGVSATWGYFTAAIAAAIVIAVVPRSTSGRAYGQESAVIGTVQAFALACGALFVSLYGGLLNSVTGVLFGTFLGVSDSQVATLLTVALVALAVLAVMARPLFFATIDPDVARARGVPVRTLSTLFLVLLACAAAEVSQITGALLVFSLLVMPAAAAQLLTASPAVSFALTLGFGLAIVWLGLAVAYFSVYPVGFYVTTFGFAVYLLAGLTRAAATRLAHRVAMEGAPAG